MNGREADEVGTVTVGWRRVAAWPARWVIGLIQLYRTYYSPTRLPVCRFVPSCSEYAVIALRTHGLFRGGGLAVIRVVKCAPWHAGGWDPVPPGREPPRRDH